MHVLNRILLNRILCERFAGEIGAASKAGDWPHGQSSGALLCCSSRLSFWNGLAAFLYLPLCSVPSSVSPSLSYWTGLVS